MSFYIGDNQSMNLIYIVEDHDVIRDGVRRYLEMSGYSVLGFENLEKARQAISVKAPDLLLQDVMLPDGDGFDFVSEIRKTMSFPVIFMTARIGEEDRIRGFELGGDDYITKPFSLKELVLRVGAVLRRTENRSKDVDRFAESFFLDGSRLSFNEQAHQASVDGKDSGLTAAEWRILKYLSNRQGTVVSRDELIKECFDYLSGSYGRIVDTHIKNIRAKLGDNRWIETVRSFGYRFAGSSEVDR